MKPLRFLDVLLILIGVGLLAMAAVGAPSAVTQSPYAVNSAGATLSALVNPDGTNAVVFFNYGTTTGYGSISSTNSISVTNAAVETTLDIDSLLARVPYHYRAVMIAGTNTVYGQDVVFTTANYTYTYDGTGLTACDPTRPQDYEPGSILGAALRQFKQQVLGAFNVSHNPDGTLRAGIVTSSNLAPGAVSFSALSTNLQDGALANTNTVTGGVNSNLFTLGATWTTNIYKSTSSLARITTNTLYTVATGAFPNISISAQMSAYAVNGGTKATSMSFPITIYVNGTAKWSQYLDVSMPNYASASNSLSATFLTPIASNDVIRIVVDKAQPYPTREVNNQAQTFNLTSFTVTGYQ
jgi:hypothetical protein